MKKLILFTLTLLSLYNISFAQYSEFRNEEDQLNSITIGNKENGLQLNGRIAAYYENRWLKDGQTNLRHNGFAMKDADIDILGKTKNQFIYELQVSLLDLVSAASMGNTNNLQTQNASNASPNPQNTGFKAAYMAYEGDKLPFHVKLGYDKVPYSQGSLNDAYSTPMWSHANLVGGDFFSRRDMGITLYKSLWKQRINIYAGAYSGLGENVFEYGNDASGKPEYIGRIDVSYPSRFKYSAIDEASSPIPVFRVGLNARYTDKTQPAGHSLTTDVPDAPGAYGIRIINGKKTMYGGDFIIKYKGISLLFEADLIQMQPADAGDALYGATPTSFNNGMVKAGGITTGINYNWKSIHSTFSVNYEQINGNDLIAGDEQWLYLGYAYKVNGFNSVLKLEYYKPLKEDVNLNPLKYTSQLRIGYQFVF